MNNNYYTNFGGTIIEEQASLNRFYVFTTELSKNKHVRFTGKDDDVDNIDWHFKYRGKPLTLQFNMFNGISLLSQRDKDIPAINEVAGLLTGKTA
ncbi:MAG: hypothetical protein J0I41_18910 [Filimonas sp.]|nr:hypothetical protein [Filimonas sp.]